MSTTAFAVHLGGGLYLDSDGSVLQTTPPPGVPVYEAPFQLPVDPKAVKGAVEGVQKALKDINKDPAVLAQFAKFGFDTGVLDLLSGVAKIAGMVAPVLAVASFAYDLAKLFGAFGSGPTPLELLVKQRFEELEANVESVKLLIQTKDLRDGRLAVENFLDGVGDYVDTLANSTPTVAQLEGDRTRLFHLHDEKRDRITALVDPTTWVANFDREEHTRVWPFAQHALHTRPDGMRSAPVRAVFPADSGLAFDHRLMVPLASFATEAYLTGIRGMVPEHRSSGDFREQLRRMATKLDGLAEGMRANGLGFTHYSAADFAPPGVVLGPSEVLLGSFVSPLCSRWPVGAMDLRYHGDRFFGPFLDGLFEAELFGRQHPTTHGGMNFRWTPPAKLAPGPWEGTYVITNPDECAAAANAAAEKPFAELLSVSGYTELLRLAALCRNESTEPTVSQTVDLDPAFTGRDPAPRSTVTVSTEPILMTGVITAKAEREPQTCRAAVYGRTQPLKRARPASYRILLRTLRSIDSRGRWTSPDYSSYYEAWYERDADPSFTRMVVFTNDLVLDEVELAVGTSPEHPAPVSGRTATLQADTFDWWIPTGMSAAAAEQFGDSITELRGLGWVPQVFGAGGGSGGGGSGRGGSGGGGAGGGPAGTGAAGRWSPATRLDLDDSWVSVIPDVVGPSGDATWDGQRRDCRTQSIEVSWDLSWVDDELVVRLRSRPQDRNHVLHLVIEETLTGSGQKLHTATPVQVNGQLTFVPRSFLDKEAAAIAKLESTLREFERKYRISHEVGPGDDVIGWLRPGDLASLEGLARFEAIAREKEPDLFAQVVREVMSSGPGGEAAPSAT